MKIRALTHSEQGAMTFFVALVLLPLTLFALYLALDLRNYHSASEAAQRDLDNAVLSAARALPYQNDAAAIAKRVLSSQNPGTFGQSGEHVSVSTQGDTISLEYRGNSTLFFGTLLAALSGGGKAAPATVAAFAQARLTPFDVFIALDSSATYLAPAYSAAQAWDDEKLWPAASFFAVEHEVIQAGKRIDSRIATQQCFNPAFSAMKHAALQAYSYFSSFERDQVGVGVFPGYGKALDVLRPVRARSDEFSISSGAESNVINYASHNRADVFCLAAAERENNNTAYRFPVPNAYLTHWSPKEPVPLQRIIPPEWELNQAFIPVASVAEVLWGSVVRAGPPVDFRKLLHDTAIPLLGASIPDARTGLRSSPIKQLLIFAGDVPWINGARWVPGTSADEEIKSALSTLRDEVVERLATFDMQFKVSYIIFDHAGNGGVARFIPELSELFSTASTVNGIATKAFSAQAQYVQNADVLTRNLMPLLTLEQRNVVLSR